MKVLQARDYSDSVMRRVRNVMGLEDNDESRDTEIRQLSPKEVFDYVLSYEGIIHFTDTIINWIDDIYEVDLDDIVDWVKVKSFAHLQIMDIAVEWATCKDIDTLSIHGGRLIGAIQLLNKMSKLYGQHLEIEEYYALLDSSSE